MVRILIVGDFLPDRGGVSTYVLNLSITLLVRYKHKVSILHTKKGSDIHFNELSVFRLPHNLLRLLIYTLKGLKYSVKLIKIIPLLTIKPKDFIFATIIAGRLSEILWKQKFNIVHSNHLSLRSLITCIVAKENRIPCIITAHGYDTEFPSNMLEYSLRKACIDVANRIIILTRVKSLRVAKLYNAKNLVVVPNFVLCSKLNEYNLHEHKLIAKKTFAYNNMVVLTYIGRIVKEKGVFDALKVIEDLEAIYPRKVVLLIAGKGRDEQKLKKLISEKRFKCVKYMGEANEVLKPNLLLATDVLLLPTYLKETFPTVLIEAMNYGAVPIVYYFPGIEEIFEHGIEGFILPQGDVRGLLSVVEKIISGEINIQEIQLKALARSRKYCAENVVLNIIKIYWETLYETY